MSQPSSDQAHNRPKGTVAGRHRRAAPRPKSRPVNERIERLKAFAPEYRKYLARISARSQAMDDLLSTFPALIFALATGFGTDTQRAATFRAIADGAKRKEAAATLGLPWWTRKLPASALRQRLDDLAVVPPKVDQQFAATVPAEADTAATWLAQVLRATAACDADFGLWMAKNGPRLALDVENRRFNYLCAWAWYSDRPETQAGRLIRKRWHAGIRPRSALEEMRIWHLRLGAAAALAALPQARWPRTVRGLAYEFVPLLRPDEMLAESLALQNCLDHYGTYLECGQLMLISVRRQGQTIACAEVLFPDDPTEPPRINQLKGLRNRPCSPELQRAAHRWITSESVAYRVLPAARRAAAVKTRMRQLWMPYLLWLGDAHAVSFDLSLRETEKAKRKARRDLQSVGQFQAS
ncbi:MAG: hypothetical protein AAFY27_01395 [Pseudomonadota bacterium]